VFSTTEGGGYTASTPLSQARLTKEGTGYVYTRADQSKLTFNASGQLLSVIDRNGNAISMTYNGAGQLNTVADAAGRKLSYSYNAEGRVEKVTDPMGHTVKYGYTAGNLTSVTEPGETAPRWQFKYDSSHQLIAETDGLGHTTTTEYNSANRVISQTDALGRTRKWSYSATVEGSKTTITEPNGAVTVESFTAAGQPASVTHAAGTPLATTTTDEYNAAGDLISQTDPLGNTTTYEYDAAGDRTSETDPLGNTTKWTYNSAHEVTSTTTPNGETTTTELDSHGNPISTSQPAPGGGSSVTTYKYDVQGDLESETDPMGRTSRFEYDRFGDRVAETNPEGDKRTFVFDEDSNVIATVSPRGNATGAQPSKFTTKMERDPQERVTKTTNPLGKTSTKTYDAAGLVEKATDPDGHITSYTYNDDNELISTKEPTGAVSETGYNSSGEVISQTDGNKHTTRYIRNLLGQISELIDPLGRISKRDHNADGNVIAVIDAAARTTTYSYDADGRLTEESYSDGKTPNVKYEYNASGQRTKMVDGTGTTSYAYDQLGRMIESVDGHGSRTAYEYDLDGEQTKITYPNGKAVVRTFDNAGRLKSVTDWLGHTITFSYDADSDLTATVFPKTTGDEDLYTYNEADQLTKTTIKKGTKKLALISYAREKNGQVKTITPKDLPGEAKAKLTYDGDDRIASDGTTDYDYDAAGNPTKTGSTTSTYSAADELEKSAGTTYSYDELGERTKSTPTSGAAVSYGYDQAGNLIAVNRAVAGTTPAINDSYTYDGNGLRATQTVSGTTSQLSWDASESLPLLLNDGVNSYVYGPGGLPLEQIPNTGATLYFHHDQQGSTRALTGETGNIEATFAYSPYGALIDATGSANTPLGFDGQLTDPDTGLIYLRARSYDPATAQFLTVDPLQETTRQRYQYAADDPISGSDPTGLTCGLGEPWDCIPGVEAAENFIGEHPVILPILGCTVGLAVPVAGEAICGAAITSDFVLSSKTNIEEYERGEISGSEFTEQEFVSTLTTVVNALPGEVADQYFELLDSLAASDDATASAEEELIKHTLYEAPDLLEFEDELNSFDAELQCQTS
jgi:RHS repeat-associated protein